ncbi:TetR/AcrR family transcriptional regulator [Spirillospora sp. NPDC048911]|uniref:TetR/AcrR family transcriptional regulator n=1 Tax=Spirillospora sp. NPDC048911 TaxID=3364527 RepID=UPI003716CB7E
MADDTTVVWERPERGARGPAPERSRAQITAIAVELADADGLAALSIRAVAKRLETGPASLYRYVAGRDDLLDLMADAVAGELDLGVPLSTDPVEDMVALAVQVKALHLRHPWLNDLPPEPLRLGPNGLAYLDRALQVLAPAPLADRAKLEAIATLNAMAALFARTQAQAGRTPTGRQAAQAAYLAKAAAEGTHRWLTAAIGHDGSDDPFDDPDALFARIARQVLTGWLRGEQTV